MQIKIENVYYKQTLTKGASKQCTLGKSKIILEGNVENSGRNSK